jgi:hypothetical protein
VVAVSFQEEIWKVELNWVFYILPYYCE